MLHPDESEEHDPLGESLGQLLETYPLATILMRLRDYTQTKATLLRTLGSDRAHQWVGLTKLIDTAISVSIRIGSEEERLSGDDESCRDT